ncbi:hypothetical protein FJTKL_08629 [Diaporthe vaccinii]|uniref:Reverse transcriptase domain-containing protein n=1 Tax=Diaporthe vaccinii TaxID=105482 RepID=A0ABR4ER45_9PEZI
MYMEAVYGEGKTSREHSVHPDLPPDIDCSLPPGHELDRMVPDDDKQLGEVLRAIKKLPDRKATGVDIIGNEALKMVGDIITPHLENIFPACLVKCYYPNFLKLSRTILFPKPEKDAHLPTSYRPIALLTSIGKLLEKVILERLRRALNLLPKSLALPLRQFGGLAGKSTTAALHNLLNFVHIGLAKKLKVSVLGLDITGAFPHTDRNKLLKMLADKGVPGYIIKIIWSWMCNRMTVLEIPGHEGQVYFENGGLPQGSCLSPTLFLIFASPLFDVDPFHFSHAFNIFAFVDDTYITVRSTKFETNCKVLAWVHGQLQNWAMGNAVTFDPQKYHLLHFLGPDDGVRMIKTRPSIDDLPPDERLFDEKEPFIKILGVLVDNRLSWKFHIDHVVSRVSKSMRALKQMSGSTWGPDLQRMRMLYTSQIQSAFSYASPAWFITGLSRRKPGTLSAKQVSVLDKLQEECLYEISGAMKGTSAHVIRKELCIPKMSVYLKMRTLAYIAKRTYHCPNYCEFEKERMATLTYPPKNLKERFEHHPLQQLQTQADKVIEAAKERLEYHHGHEDMLEKWSKAKTRNRAIDKITWLAVHAWCSVEWERYREDWDKTHSWARPLALAEPWGFDSLLYYDDLSRKECTVLLHCRTGNIGLAANLHSRALHPTESCPLCGKDRHTIEHLFVHCTGRDCYGNDMTKRRATLYKNTAGLTDLHLIFAEYPEEAVRFAFKTFGIPQFTKASWKVTEAKRWGGSQANKRGRSEATAGAGVDQDAPVKKRKRHIHLDLRRGNFLPVAATFDEAAA